MNKSLIYIVEDDPIYAELIKFNLQEHGLETIEHFDNGKEGIMNLYKQPKIVILDFQLGDMNGLQVLEKIKSHDPDIHVILLTGHEDINIAISSLKYGAIDFLIKNDDAMPEVIDITEKIFKLEELHQKEAKSRRSRSIITAILAAFGLGSLLLHFI